MMMDDGLPLGAQSQMSNDDDEQQHFQQVIQSYQQYATFHQTRQRGINRRLHNLLRSESRRSGTNVSDDDVTAAYADAAAANLQYHHPTLQSILPPSLIQPSSTSIATASDEYHTYQKEFSAATIRNQFFLDNILQYSNQETSQDVLRRWRQQQQHQQQHPQHECTNSCNDDNDGTIVVNHNGSSSSSGSSIEWTTEDRISKIDSVLKSMARDWSIEGYEERSVVYNRMIMALERYLPLRSSSTTDDATTRTTSATSSLTTRTPHRVAVPGSGLGRLAWEIYSRGYSVQGSDFSLPMLLASDFILNGCGGGGGGDGGSGSFQQFRISPWLAETKNVSSFRDRVRTVIVPDVDPTAIDHSNTIDDECSCDGLPEFTMLAGEFLHLYAHHLPEYECTSTTGDKNNSHRQSRRHHQPPDSTKKFHAVVCSFFIDTAPSLPHYLLTIYHMLEEGGLFILFGPLMYHWSGHGALLPGDDDNGNGRNNVNAYEERNKHLDSRYLTNIDYTWEEVRYMIVQCGFDIIEEEMRIPAHYAMDGRSMMKVGYDCVFCVARKKVVAYR